MKRSDLIALLSERYSTSTPAEFSEKLRWPSLTVWLLAVAAAVAMNHDLNVPALLDTLLYFLVLHLVSVLLSTRLPYGAYGGLTTASIVCGAVVMGYRPALVIRPLVAAFLMPLVLLVNIAVPHLRRYRRMILHETMWNSARVTLSLLVSGWVFEQVGLLPAPSSVEDFGDFVAFVVLFFLLNIAFLLLWLAQGRIAPLPYLRRYSLVITGSDLAAPLIFAPLFAAPFFAVREVRLLGLVLYTLGVALLYLISQAQVSLGSRIDELRLLNSIGQVLNSTLNFDDLLASLRSEIGKMLDVSGFYLALVNDAHTEVNFVLLYEEGIQQPAEVVPFANGLTEYIIRTRQPVLINHDPEREAARMGLQPTGRPPKSYLGVPIIAGDRVIGVMALRDYTREYAYDWNNVRLLETIAASAGVALRNAQLYQQSQQQADEFNVLYMISSLVSANLEMEVIFQTVCRVVTYMMQCQKAALFLIDEQNEVVRLAGSVGLSHAYCEWSREMPLETGRAIVARTGETLTAEDVWSDPRFVSGLDIIRAEGFRAVLEVPLTLRDRLIGSITAYYEQPRHFTAHEIELMRTLGGQVALAVENAQLFDNIRTRQRQLEVLYQTGRTINASLSVPSVLRAVAESMINVLEVDACVALLADADNRTLRSTLWVIRDGDRVVEREGETVILASADMPRISRAIREEDILVLRSYGPQSTEEKRRLLRAFGLKAGVGLPLTMHGEVIGLIVVGMHSTPREFDPATLQLAHALANQAASAIQNARLFERTDIALTRRLGELFALESVLQRMTRRLDLLAVIEQVVTAAEAATGAEMCEVALHDPRDDMLKVFVRHGLQEERVGDMAWPADYGLTGRAFRTGRPVLVNNVTHDPEYLPARLEVRSELVVPIVLDGRALGVINLESVRRDAFDEDQQRFVTSLAEHAAIAIQNARLFEAVQERAEEFQTLRAIAVELLSTTDLQHILQLIAREALQRVQARDVYIFLYDQATDRLTFGTSLSASGVMDVPAVPPRPTGMTATVARSGERMVILSPHEHPLFRGMQHGEDWRAIEAIVSVPLKRGPEVIGVFNILFDVAANVTDDALHFLDMLAAQAAVAIATARLTEETRTSRDRLQAILDSVHEGILMFDMNGLLVLANPRVEYLLNLRMADYLGKHFTWILKHMGGVSAAEEAFSVREAIGIARALQENPTMITRRRYMLRQPTPRMIEETSLAVVGADEELLGRLFIMRDVTQEYEIELYREEMSHMLVHDLRSPLAGVITSLSIAEEELESMPADSHRDTFATTIRVALSSANDLLRLVEEILDVNRLEAGEVPLVIESVNLHEIAAQAYNALHPVAAEAGIEVTINAPDDLAPIRVDADKIRRVMLNLLDNALRYTPDGGQVRIDISAEPAFQTIVVTDTGEGVPEELRERIFERFVQGDVSRRKRGGRGSGLGLTFCRLAVEAHGGRIWVDSGPEGGAAFHVVLPGEPPAGDHVVLDDEQE